MHTEPRAARVFQLASLSPRPGERCRYPAKRGVSIVSPRRILIGVVVALFVLVAGCYLIGTQLILNGNHRVLQSIQDVHYGMTKTQVQSVMGTEYSMADASSAPHWITSITGNIDGGEFWWYYMGFPPRNLIIYFDDEGKVVFVTWEST